MNIEVAKTEVFLALESTFGHVQGQDGIYYPGKRWADLTVRESRWLVAKILRNRNDNFGNAIASSVESGNPNYSNFVLVDDLPANMGI